MPLMLPLLPVANAPMGGSLNEQNASNLALVASSSA